MATQDKSVYVDVKPGSEQMYQVFNSGKMAMVPTGPWQLPEIIERQGRLRRRAAADASAASR